MVGTVGYAKTVIHILILFKIDRSAQPQFVCNERRSRAGQASDSDITHQFFLKHEILTLMQNSKRAASGADAPPNEKEKIVGTTFSSDVKKLVNGYECKTL